MIRFKLLYQVLVLLGALCGAQQTMAASECLDPSKVKEIIRDFKFEGNAELNGCDPKDIGFQVLKSILFIKEIKGTGSTVDPFALNVLKERPYEYFKKRIDTIIFEDRSANCDRGFAAYVYARSASDHGMRICRTVYSGMSPLEQASTLIHEARHFEGFDHVNCIRGPLKYNANNSACDSSYEEAGPYAVEISFYIRILQDSTVAPALRRSARMNAAGALIYRFISLPADLKDGAFLTDKNKTVSFFDGKSSQPVLQMKKDQSLLYASGAADSPRILNWGSDQNTELTHGLAPLPDTEGFQIKGNILGSANSEHNSYFLFEKGLLVFSDLSDRAVLKFSQIQPLSIFERLKDDGTIEVVLTDWSGRWAVLPKSFEKLKVLRESDLKMETNKAGILKIQTWQTQDKDIILTMDGRLSFFNRQSRSYTPILPGNSYLNVIAPVVWSKSLQNL